MVEPRALVRSATIRKQRNLELSIFRAFAKVSSLRIDLSSIEKREPPEPDIRCIAGGTERVNFELVELLDQGHAQRISAQLELSDHFSQCYYNASDALRRRLQVTIANACVVLAFKDESTIRARRESAEPVLESLRAIEATFEGDLSPSDLGLPNGTAIRRITILRGNFVGPWFEYPTAGSLADPAVELIGAKLRKQYQSEHSLELLAYYYRQPQTATPRLPPDLPAFVEKHLPESSFRRVWIFSVVSGVLAAFPTSSVGQ